MTEFGARLPVDPLSGPAWERIREEVFTQLAEQQDEANAGSMRSRPRRRAAVWVAAIAAAAVAATVMLGLRGFPGPAAPISMTSRIVATSALTRTTIGDVTVEVSLGTELVVTSIATDEHSVVLENGHAVFSVPKRHGRAPFRVQAGDVLVQVLGTQFSVWRAGDAVRVTVAHGSVRVTSGSAQTVLHPGSEWSSPAALEMKRAPTAAESAAPKAPEMAAAPARARPAGPIVVVPEASSAERSPAIASRPASAQSRYEAASRLERQDPGAAVSLYRQLADEGGPWAANALYAAGRLELERGRRDAAKDLLTQYLTRFPRGANVQEARLLLKRIP